MVAVLSAFALSAVASASASAEACKKKAGSKNYVLCIAGERIGSSTEKKREAFEASLHPGYEDKIVLTSLGPEITITCTTGSNKGPVPEEFISGNGSAYVSEFRLTLSNCSVGGELKENCTVQNIVLPEVERAAFGPLAENIKFGTEERHRFMIVPISGTGCVQAGIYEVDGTQECTLTEAEVERVEQALTCNPEKSRLTIPRYTASASLSLRHVMIKLSGNNKGKTFSIVEH